jgi:hypothetical protein
MPDRPDAFAQKRFVTAKVICFFFSANFSGIIIKRRRRVLVLSGAWGETVHFSCCFMPYSCNILYLCRQGKIFIIKFPNKRQKIASERSLSQKPDEERLTFAKDVCKKIDA